MQNNNIDEDINTSNDVLLVDKENDNNNDIVLSSPVLVGRTDDGYDDELISEFR